jgi:hypothetical protein
MKNYLLWSDLLNDFAVWMFALSIAVAAAAAGALLYVWWMGESARKRRAIPQQWPLSARALANSEERKVWRWLAHSFSDHHVMIKVPVTSFTLPSAREQSLHWYEVLSGVYCTLTVCRSDGQVIGCVDVLGERGLPRSHRHLKQSLLSQCGIAYCVLAPEGLPTTHKIRADFLGDVVAKATASEFEDYEAEVYAAHANTGTTRQSKQRSNRVPPRVDWVERSG